MNMTPEDFDIDFDFDKEYGYRPKSEKKAQDPDDFDLDAALARELGPDFDALFEKEFAASQAALNAELALKEVAAEVPAENQDLDSTRLFSGFDQLAEEDDEEAAPEADIPEIPQPVIPAAEEAEEMPRFQRRERRPAKKALDLGSITEKVDLKGVGDKVSGAGQVIAENGKSFVAALKDCKPGKMDKKQKRRFKNDVLPFLIGGAAVLMCLIFIIGALGRVLNSPEREREALEASIAQAEAEAAAAREIADTLRAAAQKAAEYDYQGAISTLDGYKNAETGRELTPEMVTARAEYAAAQADLVVWDDPAAITNLSFHVLVVDPARAYEDPIYANSYRNKFVTTAEFSAILEQLYSNGYVLVNLDSVVTETTDSNNSTTYTTKPIYLPSGKTPIMITETLVNYFDYMTDSNGDGAPDAGGAGFASRLVVSGGDIKAEYIDAQGNTKVGNYDLVPILNDFIDAHPDFSYRGAKAILAVTGDEGIFGWRTNKDATLVDGVKDIVEILRADGYQIASNSYANLDYGTTSTAEIQADMTKWREEIAPILGDVDIMVIARGGSLNDGSGTRFSMLCDEGFRYVIDASSVPGGVLTSDYFSQSRLMVVGSNLTNGTYDAFFDGVSILDEAR